MTDAQSIRFALYADLNANLIDGSTIWLISLAQSLTMLGRPSSVTLLLRDPVLRETVLQPILGRRDIEVIDPSSRRPTTTGLSPAEAIEDLRALDRDRQFDVVIIRGNRAAREAVDARAFGGRLWIYYLPPRVGFVDGADAYELGTFLSGAQMILTQSEPARGSIEQRLGREATPVVLLPPMVDDPVEHPPPPAKRLIYAGKFDPDYAILEMLETFRGLRESWPDLEFHVAGDKFYLRHASPSFEQEVRRGLTTTEGVIWHGGLSRDDLRELYSEGGVALGYRHPIYDGSLEVSTKVLEYGSAGLPVVINGTRRYRELLGDSYPLFVDEPTGAATVIDSALRDESTLRLASAQARTAASSYSRMAATRRLEPYVDLWIPSKVIKRSTVLIAGHDFKFINEIAVYLKRSGLEVIWDKWDGLNIHDEAESRRLLEQADAVICEWCVGNAVWYSRNKRPDQKLVVRLHRFECDTEFPREVKTRAVDEMVVVSPHIRDRLIQRFAWPESNIKVLANWVDLDALDRPKLVGAEFNLGLLGYTPRRKRLDRALDVLELLRASDDRYRLVAKGDPPWVLKWMWQNVDERTYFLKVLQRVRQSPLLRDGVLFEPFSKAVSAWYRKIGVILSTSDDEGNQVSVAEGAAARCIPVILEREGATRTYPEDWVFESTESAAAAIVRSSEDEVLRSEVADRARTFAIATHDPKVVGETWVQLATP